MKKTWMSSNFGQIPTPTSELSVNLIYNVVNTLAPSFWIEWSSFLQITRPTMTSTFGWTAELASLERLEKTFT